MKHTQVTLTPLALTDRAARERFIRANQVSFKFGAVEEFGLRDDHIDEDGEIISRETIEHCLDDPANETYWIMADGRAVGGVILKIDPATHRNHLEILFIDPEEHSKGVGYGAWLAVEALHPETVVWETCTPYFEKRNIHFYVNKCGFSAVEFFCAHHIDSDMPPDAAEEGPDEMLRFEKRMK